MVCMLAKETRDEVIRMIRDNSPSPTELLKLLESRLSYREIQEALAELLESGEILLDSDRRLSVKSRAA
jgi:hypothetical protein